MLSTLLLEWYVPRMTQFQQPQAGASMLAAQNPRSVPSKFSPDVTEDSHVQTNGSTLCLLTVKVMGLSMPPSKPQE